MYCNIKYPWAVCQPFKPPGDKSCQILASNGHFSNGENVLDQNIKNSLYQICQKIIFSIGFMQKVELLDSVQSSRNHWNL